MILQGRRGAAYVLAMREEANLRSLSDEELLRRLSELMCQSRRVEADLIAHIAEVDARRLYAREAAPSMFAYCTEILHLSEHEAFLRISVARSMREHPMLLSMLRDGRLHLSGISKLAPHLTPENREAALKRAVHKTKRQIEELVAELAPRPETPSVMRKLPDSRAKTRPVVEVQLVPDTVASDPCEPSPDQAAPARQALGPDRLPMSPPCPQARPAVVEPVAVARFRVHFTAGAELRDKLERLQALMRSSVPDGDLAKVIELAVTEKLERLESRRFAKTKRPRKSLAETNVAPRSRYIPAAVRRIVEQRDAGRCTYRNEHGRRCSKRHDLEFHHRIPFARGGTHSPDVIVLMCRVHNTLMAEHDYGKEKMTRHRRSGSRVSEATAAYARTSPQIPSAAV